MKLGDKDADESRRCNLDGALFAFRDCRLETMSCIIKTSIFFHAVCLFTISSHGYAVSVVHALSALSAVKTFPMLTRISRA